MTTAYICLMIVAVALMSAGWVAVALVVAGVAAIFGAWHRIARQARAAAALRKPIRVD